MRTDNKKRMVTVGVFVLLGILIFTAAVLTLGGQKKTFEKKSTLRAIFKDVNGLQEGNNVWFSGVKIGTVKKISLGANAMVDVVMSIQTKAMQYIKKDARAKISSEGFIGNKIIVIFGGETHSHAVAEDDVLGADTGAGTDEMIATLQQNNKNLLDITGNIKTITERLMNGQGSAGKILSNDKLANDLQAAMLGFRIASAQVQKITSDVAAYTSQLQSEGSLTYNLVHDTVFYSHLKNTAAQIQQASITIKESSENIKRITGNIETVSRRLDSTGSPVGVLLNDQEAGDNLRLTLENLQTGSKKLDEDLEAIQHNFLFRGFFKKKEKQKIEEQETKEKISD
jgi:phospholipid/cholesterol/gamma-HCH transport system substrate-binding protein